MSVNVHSLAHSIFCVPRDPCPFLQASPCKEWWPWHTLIWQSYHSCCCSLEETEYWPELLRGWPCLSSVLGKQNITPAKIVKKGLLENGWPDWLGVISFLPNTEKDETNSIYPPREAETHNPLKQILRKTEIPKGVLLYTFISKTNLGFLTPWLCFRRIRKRVLVFLAVPLKTAKMKNK